jgi:3-oxoacyl-[acyl-carrier protein] reductase
LTGCASGIGRHLAGVLAVQGHRLLVTDTNQEALTAHATAMDWNPEQVLVRRLDVRNVEEWRTLIDLALTTWGRLDILNSDDRRYRTVDPEQSAQR